MRRPRKSRTESPPQHVERQIQPRVDDPAQRSCVPLHRQLRRHDPACRGGHPREVRHGRLQVRLGALDAAELLLHRPGDTAGRVVERFSGRVPSKTDVDLVRLLESPEGLAQVLVALHQRHGHVIMDVQEGVQGRTPVVWRRGLVGIGPWAWLRLDSSTRGRSKLGKPRSRPTQPQRAVAGRDGGDGRLTSTRAHYLYRHLRSLRTCQRGLRAAQRGLRAAHRGLGGKELLIGSGSDHYLHRHLGPRCAATSAHIQLWAWQMQHGEMPRGLRQRRVRLRVWAFRAPAAAGIATRARLSAWTSPQGSPGAHGASRERRHWGNCSCRSHQARARTAPLRRLRWGKSPGSRHHLRCNQARPRGTSL